MHRRYLMTVLTMVSICCGAAAVSAQTQGSADAAVSQRRDSPQALLRVFLLNSRNLESAQPEQVATVLGCLELPNNTRKEEGVALAIQLEALIDHAGVDLDKVPAQTDATHYEFTDDIVLAQQENGLWQFSADTLARISGLHADLQKKVSQKASDEPPPDSEAELNPALVSPRATTEHFLDAMEARDTAAALECLDLSAVGAAARDELGPQNAEDLKYCIDRIAPDLVLQTIPDDPDEPSPYIWKTLPPGSIALHKVTAGKYKGSWQFSPNTLKTIGDVAAYLVPRGSAADGTASRPSWRTRVRSWIPDELEHTFFALEYWQWIGLLLLLVLGVVLDAACVFLLTVVVGNRLSRAHVAVDKKVTRRSLRPIGLLVMAVIWWAGLKFLAMPEEVLSVFYGVVKFFAAAAGVWTFYKLVDLAASFMQARAKRTTSRFDDVLVPLIRKSLKIFITAFGLVFIADVMDWDLKGLLAGLGIGGLAIAFAARESLGNIFGSATILLDRPFQIGDWVNISGKDGTVESVGFRSTKIRTFYNSVISIPNAQCVNSPIDNYGERQYRRFKTMLSVLYSTTPEQLEAFCEGVRELIRKHPYTRKDYYHVYVNVFAASSIDILLYMFFNTPDWATELRERHRLMIDIIRLAHELGVEFAFPTQTLHLYQEDPPPEVASLGSPQEAKVKAKQLAEKIAHAGLGQHGHIPPPVSLSS